MARFGHLAKALVVEAMDVPGSWKMRMRPTDCRWQRLPLLQTQTGQIAGTQIGGAPLTPSNCRPTPPPPPGTRPRGRAWRTPRRWRGSVTFWRTQATGWR